MKKKIGIRILTFLMAIGMFVTLFPANVAAAGFSDVKGHWAEAAIYRWTENGALKGYEDGTFRPNNPVTRAELATILNRITEYSPPEYPVAGMDTTSWYYKDVAALLDARLIYAPNGEFDVLCPREEAFQMIAYAFGVSHTIISPGDVGILKDFEQTSMFAYKAVKDMKTDRLITGYPDRTFRPKDPITRAEIVTILDKMIKEVITEPGEYVYEDVTRVWVTVPNVKITLLPSKEEVKGGRDMRVLISHKVDTKGAVTIDLPKEDWLFVFHAGKEQLVSTYTGEGQRYPGLIWTADERSKPISQSTPKTERMALAMGSMLNYINTQPLASGPHMKTETNVLPTNFFNTPGGLNVLNSASWGINNHDDLVNQIEIFIGGYGHNTAFLKDAEMVRGLSDEDIALLLEIYKDGYMFEQIKAWDEKWGDTGVVTWDLFRAANLVMWGYNAEYLTYDEAMKYMEAASKELSKYFDTWDEAYDNYLDGYAWWSRSNISKERSREDKWVRMRGFYPDVFDNALLSD